MSNACNCKIAEERLSLKALEQQQNCGDAARVQAGQALTREGPGWAGLDPSSSEARNIIRHGTTAQHTVGFFGPTLRSTARSQPSHTFQLATFILPFQTQCDNQFTEEALEPEVKFKSNLSSPQVSSSTLQGVEGQKQQQQPA